MSILRHAAGSKGVLIENETRKDIHYRQYYTI